MCSGLLSPTATAYSRIFSRPAAYTLGGYSLPTAAVEIAMAADPTAQRARCVAATHGRTATAVSPVSGVTRSPRTSADHTSVSTGWASWTCPTLATPPRARPAYQAKNARNIEIAETYAKPSQAVVPASTPVLAAAIALTTTVSGADTTSAQQIVFAAPSVRESAPPSA